MKLHPDLNCVVKPCRGLILVALTVALLTTSCKDEMTKAELDIEVAKHSTETINNVWYAGTFDGFDYLIHKTALKSHRLRIKEGEIILSNRFSLTRDKAKWLLLKGDTDFGMEGDRIRKL